MCDILNILYFYIKVSKFLYHVALKIPKIPIWNFMRKYGVIQSYLDAITIFHSQNSLYV